MNRDTWSAELDEAHPIRWESADGAETWYLDRHEALARIGAYYRDPVAALAAAGKVRTPFAFYTDTEHPMTKRAERRP